MRNRYERGRNRIKKKQGTSKRKEARKGSTKEKEERREREREREKQRGRIEARKEEDTNQEQRQKKPSAGTIQKQEDPRNIYFRVEIFRINIFPLAPARRKYNDGIILGADIAARFDEAFEDALRYIGRSLSEASLRRVAKPRCMRRSSAM